MRHIYTQNVELESLSKIIDEKTKRINELECRLKYIIDSEHMTDVSIDKDVLRLILK